MKKFATLLAASALLALTASAAMAANQVRISQVYGGGGAGSTTTVAFRQDYVEIFNSGASSVDVSNWTIEYGSATGAWGSSTANIFTFPSGTILPACSYLLVANTTGAGGVGADLTGYDFTMTLNVSATSGKVALFNAVNSNLACNSELAGTLVDKVSFGSGNCPEVANAPAPSTTTSDMRGNAGMNDTDDNSVDFTAVAPAPHFSGVANRNPLCLATPTTKGTWGQLKSIYR